MRRHHRAKPFEGVVTIGQYSGLRKRMRAARRDKIPPEWMQVITNAMLGAARSDGQKNPGVKSVR